MPKEKAAPDSGREAAQVEYLNIAILPDLGVCANCGERIRVVGEPTPCPLCTAWRKWFVSTRRWH